MEIRANKCKIVDLERLGVSLNISKLLISKNEVDFLIGWELVRDYPNQEYIRAYCKGNTSLVRGLEYNWEKHGRKYYDSDSCKYTFGDIIIDNSESYAK